VRDVSKRAHFVHGDAREDRHALEREDLFNRLKPSRGKLLELVRRSGGLEVAGHVRTDPIRKCGEEAAHEAGVVAEQGPQFLRAHGERHGNVHRPDRAPHLRSLERLDEPERRRRLDRTGLGAVRGGGHPSIEQHVDRGGHDPLLQQHGPGLVPYLLRCVRDPEQFVDADGREERKRPDPARDLRRGQRFDPELAPAGCRHPPFGKRP
jgi:hypothetical protein